MKKILVIGGAGLIGRNLIKKLNQYDYKIYIYDFCKSYLDKKIDEKFFKKKLKGLNYSKFINGDIRDKKILKSIIYNFDPSIIVHLGNLPLADYSNDHPKETISNILLGTINVLEILRNYPKKIRLIYASSSMVYGDFKYSPCDENHPKSPKDVYGATKLATETMISTYQKRYGIEYTIIRPSSVYGPNDMNKRVVQIFIENAIKNKPLILHNRGASLLDFTYVEDIATGLYLSIKKFDKSKNEIFNITAGKSRSLKDLVNILQKHFSDLKIQYSTKKLIRPKRGTLDISKAKKLLQYKPKYNLEKGIKKYLSHYKI
tara:strand:+ start:47 stop:997 length:951 start_codon:yes stop_codon:yes gene_type:complete